MSASETPGSPPALPDADLSPESAVAPVPAEAAAPTRWERVKAAFELAQEQPAHERVAWATTQMLDPDIRADVLRLLRADAEVGERFEAVAFGHLPPGMLPPGDGALVGRRVGVYEIVRRIGEGGMGTVYEAVRADEYRERVAVKTVWRGVDSALLAHRLRSERQILASLRHPNVSALLDGGSTPDGLPFLVMEYVDGAPIDEWCDARALPLTARLDLFQQVCAAVSHAHRNLVVHRDLKPSNVMVTDDGTVKLLDFGVAKLLDEDHREGTLTGAGVSPFTAAFAAPEQVMRAPVTTATDVYALGALLHVLLTGHPPIDVDGLAPDALVLAVRDGIRAAPSAGRISVENAAARGGLTPERLRRALTGELDAIVQQALRVDPARRYATVDALLDDVRRYLRGDQVIARGDSTWYRLRTLARRRPAAATAVVAAAIVLVGGSGGAWWSARQLRVEARRTEAVSRFLGAMIGSGVTGDASMLSSLGPRVSMAEVIDSAVGLVPARFPDDPGLRARLYTALGASMNTQGRTRDAARLLDSARLLARASEGPQSVTYAAALTESASIMLRLGPARVTLALTDTALRILDAAALPTTELQERTLAVRGYAHLVAGSLRDADADVAKAIALQSRRTTERSPYRLLQLTLSTYDAFFRGDFDTEVTRARAAVRLADSIGGPRSLLYYEPAFALATARVMKGDTVGLDRDLTALMQSARQGYGPESREYATALAVRAIVLSAGGRTGEALLAADSSWMLARRISDLDAVPYTDVAYVLSNLAATAGWRWYADTVLSVAWQHVERFDTPFAASILGLLGVSRANTGRPAEGEALLRRAVDLSARGDYTRLIAMQLHRVNRIRVLTRLGRAAEVKRELALLPENVAAAVRSQLPPATPLPVPPPDPPRPWRVGAP